MASDNEIAAMRRALDLAASVDFPPNPNPRVGCVLLDAEGVVLAEAAHRGSGTDHAEVAALALAGEAAWGGTAVVTLEPCHGDDRPGRCAQALVAAGVARVVFAQQDPNPAVAEGAEYLRAAGVTVEGDVLGEEAHALNAFWSASMRLGRPVVTWKAAVSLDGRVAAADGTSRWITGEGARLDVHRLRGECDAVLVGTGTALADDPHLTVRDDRDVPVAPSRQPLRVVMGRRDLPADARVRDTAARTVQLATHDPAEALAALHAEGIRHVWLEGGPTVAGAFVRAGLVDEVITYVAPLLLGSGPSALNDAGIGTLAAGLRLRLVDVTQFGDDVRLTLFRKD
jgi:diaminohydroxyphosphoribosylaminopyrimidine deaminase / 5-amino-6-(5-phosphoribosylamino)uracil reductase